ncbi:non-ribosomal peptide synthetase [Actinophytocola gossypii]|uniref:Amino acid adenylation domain-containing protein n=1 Tax=Actinophytocola gossypii TaxID=2812003 RepID=A0ABT2J4S7_9PSEU|nr:non-ribosomal peptide synthetase [Actinophytocola gossypii]MCT2582863.1 amino acid adenylation domain-containing protein [Actinophytocola gossypii]
MRPKTAPAAAPEVYPALPLQQGMLFNGLRAPGAGIDIVQCVVRWPGLDVAAYRNAWVRAVERHPILRTGFRLDGDLAQVVHADVELDFTVRDERLDGFLAADRERGFAFDRPPLVRVTVLGGETIVVTLHHAVLDGRSLAMLLAEVDDDYRGLGEPPERPRYADFVEWLSGRDAEERETAFWRDHLDGLSGPTPLPFGRVDDERPADPVVSFTLDDAETAALRRVADDAGVTLNTIVHAAWALVLAAHAGTDDVVFGVTRSVRHGSVPGANDMVGMLLATVPLRVRVDSGRTVLDWLGELRRRALGVRDHQLAPLAGIQRHAGTPSDVRLLNSLVLFERQDLHTVLRQHNPQWQERTVTMHRRLCYPLTVYAFAEPRLALSIIHDRYPRAEADTLAGHLRAALVALATSQDRTVRELELLAPGERERLAGWSGAPGAYPRTATVPGLFAAQVRRDPTAPAVLAGDGWWSYAELDRRADRVAHALRDRGLRVEEPVGVALPRGAELVAAFLGVLKAGGAYLPLDPANPPARTAAMLADCGARFVLADRGTEGPVETIDPVGLPDAPPGPCPATAETIAYVNYTSGSTGKPKGVAVPHRGVVRLVHEPNFATVGPGQTFLHASATSFDLTTLELWGALLTGARVVCAPPGPLEATELARLVREHRVSLLWLTAGLFHQLVEHDPATLAEVDQLLAGGDVLAPAAVRAALEARGGRPVTNGYGPTENTTFTSCHTMTDPAEATTTTPIGRPVQQTTVHVLDADLRPVPTGAPGELYTGGAGLARGYLNRPALTAERFVPDPFGPPGSRLYRTGDRARWRTDGVLEFLGRGDNQVKLRGYLVEPGEPESVLRELPAVGDAAVVVQGSGENRRLVAYLTPADVDLDAVRAAVAERLPDYLRPAGYVPLAKLPLNASGKIDRRALPAPPAASGDREHAPLTTEPQRRMADVWRALLGADGIGSADDFFDLGGNSLSAMRLTFRVREAFGVELPIREVYRTRRLAELTEVVGTLSASPTPPKVAIVRRDRSAYREAPSVPPHQVALDRNWALWRWVELRGTGFGVDPLLRIASPAVAAAAAEVNRLEREFYAIRGVVLDWIKAALTVAPAEDKPRLRRDSKMICKGRLDELSAELSDRADVDDVRAAADRLAAAQARYAEAFAAATGPLAAALRDAADDPRFREAVGWQNPRALHTAVDSLRRAAGDPARNSQYRQWEALVTSYLQRYATKNDTIGFFGPVGWARVVDDATGIDQRPGPGLLANRTVYLENWAVHALAGALSTEDRLPWAVPRRMPFVGIEGDLLHVPLRSPLALDPDEAAVLRAVDGRRTAHEIAAELPGVDVYGALRKLRDERRIAWAFEVSPAELVPQDALRRQLAAITDDDAREPALAALDEVEAGRRAVAAATGDPDRLTAGIAALQEAFTRHTGAAAVRRPGQFYAGRTLVHEECRRDTEVTIGPDVLATLWPPLTLLLESARWFTSAGAALYRRALRDIHRERATATGASTLRFADFWLWANDVIFRLDQRVVGRLTGALQERWAGILDIDRDARAVTFTADAVRDQVSAAFAARRPGWRSAVQHSPDVLVAAKDAAAARAGDVTWVLGELHAGVNTMRSALFVSQHPDAAQLHAGMVHDLGGPRIVLAATREEGGTPQRLSDALVQPRDLRVVSAHDACGPDLAGALLVADLLVSEVDGRLVVHDRDGGHRMDLVELLNEQLMGQLVQQFKIMPTAPHTPRVSIDRLVVSRETWRLPVESLAFAFAADEPARFRLAQAWRETHGMPRFLFVKSPVELKPFFVDLASLPSVELLGRAVRAMDREEPGGVLTVGEMLPGPDELWLTDAAGARYTAELRLVAVDRRGVNPLEGQS